MSSLPLGICCNRRASLSRVSLQSLSTRHGFLGFFSNVHLPQSSILKGFVASGSTLITAAQLLLRLARASVAVPVTVMLWPASALVAVKVAVVPLLLNWPRSADQPWAIGHPCGSVAV